MIERLKNPAKGMLKDIIYSQDPVFSEKMMGDGIFIIPDDSVITAPCNGTVHSITNSKHAVTMVSEHGLELILHIGIDTVELGGKGFCVLVKEGELVQTGQPLLEVDFSYLKAKGYATDTLLVVLSKNVQLDKRLHPAYLKEYQDIILCTFQDTVSTREKLLEKEWIDDSL